jgi:hypothetical protein
MNVTPIVLLDTCCQRTWPSSGDVDKHRCSRTSQRWSSLAGRSRKPILDYGHRDQHPDEVTRITEGGPQRNISNFFCLHAYATGLKRHRSDYEGIAETPGTTALWSEVNGFNVGATCDLATGPARRRPNAVSTDVGPDRHLVPGLNARVLTGRRGSRVGVLMRAVATW